LQERAFFDEIQSRVEHGDSHASGLGGRMDSDDEEEQEDGSDDGNDSEADWNAAREGSISRRPAWRRPSPRWIYPFVVGAVLALGNAAPPRSELYINLACLAHPPEAPASSAWASEAGIYAAAHEGVSVGNGGDSELSEAPVVHVNATLPAHTPRSAADEWFLRLQREIYEYNRAHQHPSPAAPSHSHVSGTIPSTIAPAPTGPVPHPDLPSDSPDQGDQGGPGGSDGRDKEDPSTRGPPYREIDPALCKKSPTVQAAAARLTMGQSCLLALLYMRVYVLMTSDGCNRWRPRCTHYGTMGPTV
jgi:hypothetical protein